MVLPLTTGFMEPSGESTACEPEPWPPVQNSFAEASSEQSLPLLVYQVVLPAAGVPGVWMSWVVMGGLTALVWPKTLETLPLVPTQTFVATHRNTLLPGTALVLKKASPVVQVA